MGVSIEVSTELETIYQLNNKKSWVQNCINSFVFIKIHMYILKQIRRKQQIIDSRYVLLVECFFFILLYVLNYVSNKNTQWQFSKKE